MLPGERPRDGLVGASREGGSCGVSGGVVGGVLLSVEEAEGELSKGFRDEVKSASGTEAE